MEISFIAASFLLIPAPDCAAGEIFLRSDKAKRLWFIPVLETASGQSDQSRDDHSDISDTGKLLQHDQNLC